MPQSYPRLLTLVLLLWLSLGAARAQTTQQLLDSAARFPAMPRESGELFPFVSGGAPTFSSGTPFNDLEYTLLDTDYIDGETNGGDTFMPVDPSDAFPGADRVKLVRCVLNVDLNAAYGGADADRIILGTAEHPRPFFLRGPGGRDDDYAVIQNMDFDAGYIQLRGQPTDYRLIYATTAAGVRTDGWYLFYTANGHIDLVAFIFPCWDLGSSVSGNPPQNPRVLCNSNEQLSLTNPNHFRYATPRLSTPPVPGSVVQLGSSGKEITGGVATDAAGNMYLLGLTDGNLDNQTDAPNELFVSKVSPSGAVLWTWELAQREGALLIDAVADADFLYVCGRTLGNLPGFTNAGRWDGILLKLRLSDGQLVVSNQWGNPGIDGYGNVTLDGAGNLFVSGQGSPAGPATTDDSYLVAKHRTSDLSNAWRLVEPPTGGGFIASAEAWGGLTFVPGAAPGEGRLVAAGWFITTGGANSFISVYENLTAATPTRPHSIVLASPGIRADWILDNVVDAQGNIYVAGYTSGAFQGAARGLGDAYIAKYSPTLTNPIFKQVGTAQSDQFRKLSIDAAGTIYAQGYTYGNYSSGSYQGRNADPTFSTGDVFIQKFDASLNEVGAVQFGTPYEDRGLLALRGGTLYVGGTTEGSLAGTNQGSFDAYLVALNASSLGAAVLATAPPAARPLPLAAYPNPVREQAHVAGLEQLAQATLLDALGRAVRTFALPPAGTTLDVRTLPAGVYLLRATSADGRSGHTRLVKE